MASRPRYVFDTSVLVSALILPRSKPRQAFESARASGELLISTALLDELRDVLRRPKFDRYASPEAREEFVDDVNRIGAAVVATVAINVCRDPKDNHVLELAVSGSASCIVSGDGDLLDLNPFQGIPIRAPADFLAWLQAQP